MSLIRHAMIVVLLGSIIFGIVAVDAQVITKLPQFKSGASINIGVPVDFNTLYQKADAIYDVVEHNDSHIVWKFKGTTGDWAFVFADGRIIVATAVDFDLTAKDTLTKELNDVMDLLNVANAHIAEETRNNALEYASYYAGEPDIYHRISWYFERGSHSSNFDFTLVVPDCTIKNARLTVTGCDDKEYPHGTSLLNAGQYYDIDGQEVTSCNSEDCCDVPQKDITKKIQSGTHTITARSINNGHTITIEAITSPTNLKNFALYGINYQPWVNETTKSMDLQALQNILIGGVTAPGKSEMNTSNITMPQNMTN